MMLPIGLLLLVLYHSPGEITGVTWAADLDTCWTTTTYRDGSSSSVVGVDCKPLKLEFDDPIDARIRELERRVAELEAKMGSDPGGCSVWDCDGSGVCGSRSVPCYQPLLPPAATMNECMGRSQRGAR